MWSAQKVLLLETFTDISAVFLEFSQMQAKAKR